MPKNPFIFVKHEPRLNNIKWDQYYIDRKLVDSVVKTGEGDNDFIIVKKVVEDRISIKDTIDAQADDVGLENILKKFSLTGDTSLLPAAATDNNEIADFTQMPQDLIEAKNVFAAQEAAFKSLPEDLVKGRSFGDFMAHITQDEFNAWQTALKAKLEPKKEIKKEEGDK